MGLGLSRIQQKHTCLQTLASPEKKQQSCHETSQFLKTLFFVKECDTVTDNKMSKLLDPSFALSAESKTEFVSLLV